MVKMNKLHRLLSLIITIVMVVSVFQGMTLSAFAAESSSPYELTPSRAEGQLDTYTGNPGQNHANAKDLRVEEIGSPSYSGPAIFGLEEGTNMYMSAPGLTARDGAAETATKAVADVKGHMTLDADYTARGIYAAQYEADLQTGDGTDFWMDRILARRGGSPDRKINSKYSSHSLQHEGHDSDLLLTRGRTLYTKSGAGAGLGLSVTSMYTRNSNMGNMLNISVRDSSGSTVTLTDDVVSRYNAPSHHSSVFTAGSTGVTVEQKKFISENNVAVVLLKFINSGSSDQTFQVRATSGLANTGSVGDTELTRSNISVSIGTTVAGRLAGRHGPDGLGERFTASSSANLDSGNFTVPAGGTYEVAAMVVVTANEIPEARQDYDEFLSMNNLELFQHQTQAYNKYWVDELPYIETPNVAVNKAVAYHWWTLRYNSIDANVPGYGYQFPTTIEGVNGYNNAIVLTQGMHIQDTSYLRTGRLAYGALMSLGNINFSSAYYDNPAARNSGTSNSDNWNSHYSQYIASAGTQAYKIHGGRSDIAARLAYDFESDAVGQLDHMRGELAGENDYLMSHNIGYVSGNDGDDRSFFYNTSSNSAYNGNTEPYGVRREDRPESAYIYGAAKGAAELYDVAGMDEKSEKMSTLAENISEQIQGRMWCDVCGTFEAARSDNNLPEGSIHNGNSLIRVKMNNLLNIYSEYTVPLVGDNGETYTDGLRYAMYNDEYGIFPYYTGNSNDRHYNYVGTHNHSNINMVTLTRGYVASLKYYDREQKYIQGDYLARIFDWHAWHISSLGDISRMNNNEFFSYGTGGKSGYGTTFSVNRTSSLIDADDPRQNPNPFYEDPYDYFRYSINHNTLGNFNWLFIEGMAGFNPRLDDYIEFQPTDIGYNYFIVDNINYHGSDVTAVWVRPGVAKGGANYTYDGTENWDTIPDEIYSTYPQGFSVYMDGQRLYTIDDLKWVEYNPNTAELNFLGGDTANITYVASESYDLLDAASVDLTAGMEDAYTQQQMVDNFKKVGIDLTQDGQDLTQYPVGGGTVTPSASYNGPRRAQSWNEAGGHQHQFWHPNTAENPHAEGASDEYGPIKGTTVNWPYWSNYATTARTSDWYQVEWEDPQEFNTLKLFFFDDLRTANTSFKAPSSYTVQYLDPISGADWLDVPNQVRSPGTPAANFNQVSFEKITTTGLRVTVNNQPNYSVAISGFQVFNALEVNWVNTAPVIENLYALEKENQTDDLEVVVGADIQDDGFPQINGQYNPIYSWEITKAPNGLVDGVDYELIDADQAIAKIVCVLPDGADENTWEATFELKFSMWDGDPDLYADYPEERQPAYVEGTLAATVQSRPELRDVINEYRAIAYTLESLDSLPELPDKVIAYFAKSGARWVDVTWPSLEELEGDPSTQAGAVLYGVADELYAPPVPAYFFVRSSGIYATQVNEIDIEVAAGEEPVLPVYAVFETNTGAYDSSWLKINWDGVPSTYWISPGTYTVDLNLESDLNWIDWQGQKQRVNITVLSNGEVYQITRLATVDLGLYKVGDPEPELPATVIATWRGASIPDAEVAVEWDIPSDLFTTMGEKTVTGTVAETDIAATLTVNVIDPGAPLISSMEVPEYLGIGKTAGLNATAQSEIPGGSVEYAWTVSPVVEGNTIEDEDTNSPTVSFSNYGTYKITLTVTDEYGIESIESKYITVVERLTDLTQADVYTLEEGNIARHEDVVRDVSLANLTYNANNPPVGITASYVATGNGNNNKFAVINNGLLSTTANAAADYRSWNTYGSGSGPHYVILRWNSEFEIGSTRVMWWYDGGGVTLPSANGTTVQYWNGTAWTNVENMKNANGDSVTNIGVVGGGTNADNRIWNGVSFDPVTTDRIRLVIQKGTGNGVGVGEWEVFEGPQFVEPTTDKKALADAMSAFEALDEETYTPESFADAKEAYDAAVPIFLSLEAAQETIDNAAQALLDAIEKLEAVLKVSEITYHLDGGELPDDAPMNYEEGVGIPELPTPKKEGFEFVGWYDNEDLTGEPITEIADTGTGTKEFWAKWTEEEEPVPDVDKDALNALIAQAEDLDPDNYTEESYDAMLEVLKEAKVVAADNNATQDEVDEAAEALQEAIDALEPADEEDIPVISIDLNAGSLNMLSIGNILELNPTILPENATDKTVTYTSNNPNVASVDEDGVVTAHKTGTALITATASSGKVSKTTVRVTY